MSFIPSCDNRDDAIKSLCEIYAVTRSKIEEVLQSSEVLEIAENYHEINSQWFHFLVCSLLKAKPLDEINYAYYYHSTSYDGHPSWFDEGLLGSSEAVGRFLEKIGVWLTNEEKIIAKQEAERIVEIRSQYEGSTAKMCGPYAWNTFTAASVSQNGVSYRTPEAIQDLNYPSFGGKGDVIDVSSIIEERLKPVVVKFKGKISDIYDYCATLWGYLLSDDGELHLTHTFTGNGIAIPKEDIVRLMEIS